MSRFAKVFVFHREDSLLRESGKRCESPDAPDIWKARYTLFIFLEGLRLSNGLTLKNLSRKIQRWPQFANSLGYPVEDTFFDTLVIGDDPQSGLTIQLGMTKFVCATIRKAADTKPAVNSAESSP